MIHMERTNFMSQGGDGRGHYSYQVHIVDNEDKLSQLIALEQQLELTEKRFKRLQNYVEYIRNLYHGSLQDPSSLQICDLSNQCFPMSIESIVQMSTDPNNSYISATEFQDCSVLMPRPVKETRKEESSKRKRNTRKRSSKKSKTIIAKKNLEEDESTKLISKKAKLKIEKSIPSLRFTGKDSTFAYSSYLSPTLSSELKKGSKPNFNFRSIPFVAGKATTRSHNLGVKIQETLSIIKRNTPTEVNCKNIGRSYSQGSLQTQPNAIKSSSTLSDSPQVEEVQEPSLSNGQLKKALLYIQSDFTDTLKEYNIVKSENDPNKAEKLVQLEDQLNKKEVIITAFSKLHHQVVHLKSRLGGTGGWSRGYSRQGIASRKSNLNSYPAIKLTRLLRKIQEFQNKMQGYPEV